MPKVFSVDVPSHNIVEAVPEGAFFAKVHCFLHTLSRLPPINLAALCLSRSMWVSILLVVGCVEYFHMSLQNSLACRKRAVWTVDQNFTLKDFPMYIAEVILVA